jgi:hypothetical protein
MPVRTRDPQPISPFARPLLLFPSNNTHTHTHTHTKKVTRHLQLEILDAPTHRSTNTLAEIPRIVCPMAPCSSANCRLTVFSLVMSQPQINRARTFYYPPPPRPQCHTRELMTSRAPASLRRVTLPQARLEGPWGFEELRSWRNPNDAGRRIEPMATSFKRGGFPSRWFREVPLHPTCSRQAAPRPASQPSRTMLEREALGNMPTSS